MSKSEVTEVSGASQWTYPAFMLASRLSIIVEQRAIEPNIVPEGVRCDMERFFAYITNLLDRRGHNQEDSRIYLIFRGAFERAGHTEANEAEEMILRSYIKLVASLGDVRTLSDEEVSTAEDLMNVLTKLHERGAEEQYTDAVCV